MKIHRTITAPGLALLAIALLATLPPVAMSQPTTNDTVAPAGDPAARQAKMKARLQERLARMAERLQISATQQDAWAAYTQTVESMIPSERSRPPADADAAALVRFRSERAAEYAQKLAQLAEATAALQQVLTPEQQQTLNEMTRRIGRGGHGKHGGHGRKG